MTVWKDPATGNEYDDGVPDSTMRSIALAYFGHDGFMEVGPSPDPAALGSGDPTKDHAMIPLPTAPVVEVTDASDVPERPYWGTDGSTDTGETGDTADASETAPAQDATPTT